jgi:hypothetical protein
VSDDPNAHKAIGCPVLPPPPTAARPRSAHHARPAHKTTHHHATQRKAPKVTGSTPAATAPAVPAPMPKAASTGPTEQQKGLGPSFTTVPTLPGAVPPLPAKPEPLPPPKTAKPKTPVAAPATPPFPSLALPSSAPPAPPTLPPGVPQPAAPPGASLALPSGAPPAPPAAAAPTPSATPAPAKPESDALPAGADRITLPYSGQDTALPSAESAMLTGFVQRYGAAAQYSVQAFASIPAGDDDPSTPRRIALDRARAVQSVLIAAGAKPGQVRLLARGNAGGTPPDRVEVIAIPPVPGHTAPSSAP